MTKAEAQAIKELTAAALSKMPTLYSVLNRCKEIDAIEASIRQIRRMALAELEEEGESLWPM